MAGNTEYSAELTFGESVLLNVPGVGSVTGPAFSGTYNKLYIGLTGRAAKERARRIQLIFQDPYSSLHPRKTVRDLVGVGLKLFAKGKIPLMPSSVKGKAEIQRIFAESKLKI